MVLNFETLSQVDQTCKLWARFFPHKNWTIHNYVNFWMLWKCSIQYKCIGHLVCWQLYTGLILDYLHYLLTWQQQLHIGTQDSITLSLPSSKSTFSQTSHWETHMWCIVRIGNIIIFHVSQVMKIQVLRTVWCYISGEAAGEIWNWSLLGEWSTSHFPLQAHQKYNITQSGELMAFHTVAYSDER